MSHAERCHLGVEIDRYDDAIRRFVPSYETMLRVVAEEVAAVRPARVLDLGAGTGALAQAILDRAGRVGDCPSVVLLDLNAEMLEQARTRLAAFGDLIACRRQSYHDPLPRCDAVAASLALHHVPDMDEKRRLYERIYEALRPGGVFVNADAVVPADPDGRATAMEAWAAHMVDCGFTRERAFELFEEWAEEDTYQPLEEELDGVGAAGFEAECAWHEGPMAVVVGRKLGTVERKAGQIL